MHIMTKAFIGLFNVFGEAGVGVLNRYEKLVMGGVGFIFDGVNLSK